MSELGGVSMYIDPVHILVMQTATEEIRAGLVVDEQTDHIILRLEKVQRATNRLLESEMVVLGPRKMETTEAFHRLIYDVQAAGFPCSWCGIYTLKYPPDLWVMQEIIWQTRPDLIVETGTWSGGSALFYAMVMEQLHGMAREWRVQTIDLAPQGGEKAVIEGWWGSHGRAWERIALIVENSTGAVARAKVVRSMEVLRETLHRDPRVMVLLDSDHNKDHVLKELEIYAMLVSSGCYLIVEDTNINGHPAAPAHGPGPAEALAEWLPKHPEFEADRERERYLVSFNPGGFLKRKEG